MTTQPNEQRKAAISTCIADLKAAGVWSRLDALYVMAAHDAQAARQNWKSDNFNLVATASPLFTVDRGYKGDTSAAYLQTGFVVGSAGALMQRNSAHMGIWPLTDSASGNYVDLGARTSPTFCEMLSRIANPASNAAIRLTGAASTAAVFPLNPVTSASHLVASRLDAARVQHFQNGGMVVDAEYPSNGTPNPAIYILASNNAGTPIGLTNREISIAHFGAGLTASQTAAAHAAFRKYLQAVGAVVATVFRDDFNRADGALVGSGSNWTNASGDMNGLQVAANQLATRSNEGAFLSPDLRNANHYVQHLVTGGCAVGPFLAARLTDQNNFGAGVRYNVNTGAVQIWKREAGTLSQLGGTSSGMSIKIGDNLRIEVIGDEVQVLINGVVTSTKFAMGTAAGVTRQGYVARTNTNNPWADNYEAGHLAAFTA